MKLRLHINSKPWHQNTGRFTAAGIFEDLAQPYKDTLSSNWKLRHGKGRALLHMQVECLKSHLSGLILYMVFSIKGNKHLSVTQLVQ
jgi:hypothetical protein